MRASGLLLLLLAVMAAAGEPSLFRAVSPSGLEAFRHLSGDGEKRFIFEATSGGVCVLDFDNDGWMDVYLVNGGHLDILRGKRAPVLSRLFRNDGRGAFVDVTQRAGVGNEGAWGHGCAAADYDEDGWVDVYVTNYGPNRLYRSNGDGTFTDVAPRLGVADPRWSTGAAWADYDGDGDLDLFVANYVDVNTDHLPLSSRSGGAVEARFCEYLGEPVFCGPRGLRGAQDALFRNDGGSFTDVTRKAGLEEAVPSYGFGVLWADFDRDGRPDLFVANDSAPNYLYRNLGEGHFKDVGYASGVALSADGREQACMGADAEDFDDDGLPDIVVTNFSHEPNTLYRNLGGMQFEDVSFPSGLGEPSLPYLGWGVFFFDFDNDGDRDVFVANGHVYPQVDRWASGTAYRQRKLLFESDGKRFREVAARFGAAMAKAENSRGAAYLDYDNDGALDVVVNNLDGEPTLFRNEAPGRGHYVALRLLTGRRDAVGAQVSVLADGRWRHAELRAGASYLSQNDPRLHFGLGRTTVAEEVRIRWVSGRTTSLRSVKGDRVVVVRE